MSISPIKNMSQDCYTSNNACLEREIWDSLNDAERLGILSSDEMCSLWADKSKGMAWLNPPETIRIPVYLHKEKPYCDKLLYICDGCGKELSEPPTERGEIYLCNSCMLKEEEQDRFREGYQDQPNE